MMVMMMMTRGSRTTGADRRRIGTCTSSSIFGGFDSFGTFVLWHSNNKSIT